MTTAFQTRNNQRSKIEIVSKSCGKGKISQQSPRANRPTNKPSDLLHKTICFKETTVVKDQLVEMNKLLKKNLSINPENFIKSRQERKITHLNFLFQTHSCRHSMDCSTQPSTPINKLIDRESFA